MSETVAPAKKPVKVKKPKKPADHPKYGEMIKAAIEHLKDRKGSSRQAIVKYIKANYKVEDKCEQFVKSALKMGVQHERFAHTKGVGASGSFKLASADKSEKKPKKIAAKKPAAKKPAAKPKKVKTPKKAASKVAKKSPAKKPAAKPKKKPAKKSPKKSPKK